MAIAAIPKSKELVFQVEKDEEALVAVCHNPEMAGKLSFNVATSARWPDRFQFAYGH